MKNIILFLILNTLAFSQSSLLLLESNDFKYSDYGTLWANYTGDNVALLTDSITVVTDLSGNSRDLAVGSGLTSPNVITNGKNGHNTIRNDGVKDGLIKVSARNQPYTIFFVFKVITWTANRYLFDGTGGGANGNVYLSGTNVFRAYAGTFNNVYATPYTAGNWYLMTLTINGATSSIQINNGSVTTGDAGALNSTGISIGTNGSANAPSNMEWAEMVIFSGAISDANKTIIKNYLNTKYSIY